MRYMYGSKGDFISIINKIDPEYFVTTFVEKFKKQEQIKTINLAAPASLQGVDFSDHLNYWNLGIPALMITDTSFFRNKNYHKKTDTMETLDLNRMACVIESVYRSLIA